MTTRRVVTGHAADGRSIVVADGEVPHVRTLPGASFDESGRPDRRPKRSALYPRASRPAPRRASVRRRAAA